MPGSAVLVRSLGVWSWWNIQMVTPFSQFDALTIYRICESCYVEISIIGRSHWEIHVTEVSKSTISFSGC